MQEIAYTLIVRAKMSRRKNINSICQIPYKTMVFDVGPTAYQWFKSYLSNRQQYTNINNVSSCLTNVLCGMPMAARALL